MKRILVFIGLLLIALSLAGQRPGNPQSIPNTLSMYDSIYFYADNVDTIKVRGIASNPARSLSKPPSPGMILVAGSYKKNGAVQTYWVWPDDIGLGSPELTSEQLTEIAGQITGDFATDAEVTAAQIAAQNYADLRATEARQAAIDTAAAIRADFPTGGAGGITEAEAAAITGDTANTLRLTINNVIEEIPPPFLRSISSDGFGSSLNAPNLNGLNFTAIPLNSAGNLQGEVSLGLVAAGPYVFTVPQDADEVSRVNTTNNRIDKITTLYPRLTNAAIFRDKFNGGAFDGNYIWLTPSWAEFAVKIHPDTLQVSETFAINTYGDDAYNGAIYAGNVGRVFFVPHDSPVLKWIDVKTGAIGQNDLSSLTGISVGNRSFLSGCFTGESIFLYPRSANKIVEIDPESGAVIGEYNHPLAGQPEGAAGYFHGGTFDGRYIYLNPWGAQQIIRFDTKLKTYTSQPHNLPGNAPFSLSSVNVNGFIYFTSRTANSAAVLNTYTGSVSVVSSNLPANESGAIIYKNGKLWIASATSDNIYSAEVENEFFSSSRITAGQIHIGGQVKDVNGSEGANGQFLSSSPNGPVWSTPASGGIVGDSLSLRVLNVANLNAVGTQEDEDFFEYQAFGNTVQINDTTPSNGNGFLFQNTEQISAPGTYIPITGGAIFLEISGTPANWNNGRVFSNVTTPTSTNGLQIFMSGDRLVVRGSGGTSAMPTGNIPAGVRRVAIRFTTNSITMYVDGVEVFTEGKGFTYSFVPPEQTTFGNLPDGSRPLNAELRELVIYDTDPGETAAINYTNATTGQDYPGAVYLLDLTSPATSENGTILLQSTITDAEGNTGQNGQYLQSNVEGKVIWSDPAGFNGNFGGQRGINLAEGTSVTDATTYGQLNDRVSAGTRIGSGNALPEGSITANPGELYVSIVSGTATVWVKATGTGNTGWVQL